MITYLVQALIVLLPLAVWVSIPVPEEPDAIRFPDLLGGDQ